jgi:D-lactate dehydrogenase
MAAKKLLSTLTQDLRRTLGENTVITERAIDRLAAAHDASHYLQVPQVVVTPSCVEDIARLFAVSHRSGVPITFRSGGTSLSGQGITNGILVDSRKQFRTIEVLEQGARVRVQPGATVRAVNTRLRRYGRKLGPDPASEIACTIGGIVSNNSSGMSCGTKQNTYRTLDSLTFVLPSGTVVDTSLTEADDDLRTREPELHRGLVALRDRIRGNGDSVAAIRHQFSMKNTMGYGLNSFLDFDKPVDILAHLIIGGEGTLGFVAEATFRSVELPAQASTALAIFEDLNAATAALPDLVATGLATIELMDATSLRVAQTQAGVPRALAELPIDRHAALLLEYQGATAESVAAQVRSGSAVLDMLPLTVPLDFTTDPQLRAALWHIRKGLYTAIAGARPSGTNALLEDIVVPVPALLHTCEALIGLFDKHGYEGSVIFGHAKDGNIHFMINERFEDPQKLERYRRFTEDMVDLVLGSGGSLKAEHGTGRIMAPFVRRQYGDELYDVMCTVKLLCDPTELLNPGAVLSADPDSYVRDLKLVPTVESEVDRCVECGYCEPACPSKNITMTPRQRIVVRREMRSAEAAGDTTLLAELQKDYDYEGIDTCAVDGMCEVACPVDINTGDLVRRLRAENAGALGQAVWKQTAQHWGALSSSTGLALSFARMLPAPLVTGVTRVGRALLGPETVPLYDRQLPGGGSARAGRSTSDPEAVYFPSCIGTMFGAANGGAGVSSALLTLCSRAGIPVAIPEGIGNLCCGTPWKSKGYADGYELMTDTVLSSLWAASNEGLLPIICDATSCTEGLETMRNLAIEAGGDYARLQFVDSIQFVYERVLNHLTVTAPISSLTIHHTCSSTQLGTNEMMTSLAERISADVQVPMEWGCCGFAGDRGLLHPELTASATEGESAEINSREYAAYASANRTCELGMSRATGHEYQHLLELLENATRPTER